MPRQGFFLARSRGDFGGAHERRATWSFGRTRARRSEIVSMLTILSWDGLFCGLCDIAAGPFPFLLDLALGQRLGFRPSDDHEIDADWHEIRQFPKCFTRRPLHAIAYDRISDFARNDDSEARRGRRTQGRRAHQEYEMRRRRPKRAILDAQKFSTRPEAGSQGGDYFLYVDTARRLRPLRRRFASTLLPPRVDMRERKPCVRTRRILWG
jgi:hypothetical protein